ncbi:hypothetical protein BTUL_0237g00160 [Botrytis tulipae]|uniref:Uncharacterized protein n=1 Tax=Botrytis tulipae TaxID=87230 RepID=A0A4Z1E9I9_9HELO|nr:hypothetical protein BTUL_0237g00160 [Botrytis tulipae]
MSGISGFIRLQRSGLTLPPFEDPKLPTPRAVENCFLCSKLLGSYLAEPASQAKYIEALRLNSQHVLDDVSKLMDLSYGFDRHKILKNFSPGYHYTEEESKKRRDSPSREQQSLVVYLQKRG